jgi:hypothetical protein
MFSFICGNIQTKNDLKVEEGLLGKRKGLLGR